MYIRIVKKRKIEVCWSWLIAAGLVERVYSTFCFGTHHMVGWVRVRSARTYLGCPMEDAGCTTSVVERKN